MGVIDGVEVGKKLMRDQWNTQLYGPLHDEYLAGVEAGTDMWFHKSEFGQPRDAGYRGRSLLTSLQTGRVPSGGPRRRWACGSRRTSTRPCSSEE